MIVDTISNRKRSPIVTELLIRDRQLTIFLFLLHIILQYQKVLD